MPRHAAVIVLLLGLAACGEPTSGGPASSPPPTTPPGFQVSGQAHAGPVCPVAQDPPDPACDDRPVEGAVVIVRDSSGTDYARVTTGADGTFLITLPPGTYTIVPQPVAGLMGTAPPFEVLVVDGPVADLDVAYDTGIR